MDTNNLTKRLITAVAAFVTSIFMHAQDQISKVDSISLRVFFELSSSQINPEFSANAAAFEEFSRTYSEISTKDSIRIQTIVINSFASPEGPAAFNERLRVARNNAVLNYLKENHDIGAADLIQSHQGATSDEPYRFQRRCDVIVRYVTIATPKVALGTVAAPVGHEEAPVATPEDKSIHDIYRINTNMVYDALAVANLGFEYGFLEHWSVSLMTTFSSWDYGKNTLKFRTLFIVPEAKYYFNKEYTRHYVGAQAHVGWYNMAFKGKTRYQDKNGNTPLFGIGLNYGYVLPLGKHWGCEFSAGLGYAYLQYDKFYNTANGAQFARETKHYVGPTKLAATIYYEF